MDADRSGTDLQGSDLRHLVRLDMWTEVDSVSVGNGGGASDVGLQAPQIDDDLGSVFDLSQIKRRG